MRVLLVDNHDSFTYNLAHDIAVVSGRWPDVILNDDVAVNPRDSSWLGAYEAVMISPGPGTPHRQMDLGHSAALVTQDDVPVLGVCLGHQAIGHAYGATVARAPKPVHGQVARVLHEGRGLFHGLPSPVEMVRYHSLIVEDVRDDLVVDAWCDGLVMALHHARRPLWGVQVHPESIASSHGRRLVSNFFDLARAFNARRNRPFPSPVTERRTLASPPTAPVAPPGNPGAHTVQTARVPFDGRSEDAFAELFRDHDHAWWLDSTLRDARSGRFSYMGSAAGPLARVVVGRSGGGFSVSEAGEESCEVGEVLEFLRLDLLSRPAVAQDFPFDFTLGWVGYLGYEHGTRLLVGVDTADESPEAVLVFADRCVVVDHRQREAWVLALGADGVDQRAWLEETASHLRRIGADARPPHCEAPGPPPVAPSDVFVRHGHEKYVDLVRRCLDYISAGESYELCLTNQVVVKARTDPWLLYRRLRATSPRPFGAYLAFGDTQLLSASPERLLRVSRDGHLEANPIKGTRPRGSTPDEDAWLVTELATDPKDRAENLMIVDLVRNDLGRVCSAGSVHVANLFSVETYTGVHQLVSSVGGELSDGLSALDALRAAFPGGSMTGAPKERSVALLRELEQGPRGIYSGTVGYLSLSGAADWSIVIRSIVWRPEELSYGTGGAVIALSDPEEEWSETLVKARTLGTALGLELDEILQGRPVNLVES